MNRGGLAVLALVLCVPMAALSTGLIVAGTGEPVQGDAFGGFGGIGFLVMALAYASVGAIVAARAPGNPIGWVFCLVGLAYCLTVLVFEYANYGLHAHPGLPGLTLAAWWPSESAAALPALVFLLFPDGRLASRRWRPAAAVPVAAIVLLSVGMGLRPGPLDDPFSSVSNPVGAGSRDVLQAVHTAGWVLVVIGSGLAAWSLLARLRRAEGIERQQLKLVVAVGAAVAVVTAAIMTTWLFSSEGALHLRIGLMGLAFAAFPVAAGVAILRYRLYDIDVVINRTLVYATLTALLGVAYALTAVVLGAVLGSGSAWTAAGATLAAAVAFRPLRARVQGAVDRRFNRARYDALRRIEAFLEDLRSGRAEPEAIEGLLRHLVGDPRLELRFFLPESGIYVDATGCADDAGDGRQRTAIERAGAPVGLVIHGPVSVEAPDLLARLVEAGGLAIEIARLRVGLRRQLAQVEESRARIVLAGHEERRRIERDLHDGAQQRLVSIGLALRHAQHELGGAAPAARATLDGAVAELSRAIDELRELAQGLPPAQLDAGLGPALRELAGRAPLPVRIEAPEQRLPQSVEAAAYFVACEGLTNAVKHAGASRVLLSARRRDGTLVVLVSDDGVGGAQAARGSGLRGLSDRVIAQGGTLSIKSSPGQGTTLTAELPCAS